MFATHEGKLIHKLFHEYITYGTRKMDIVESFCVCVNKLLFCYGVVLSGMCYILSHSRSLQCIMTRVVHIQRRILIDL